MSNPSPKIPAMLWVAYFGFAMFGFSEVQLGVAWPSIRETFSMPVEALGMLITAGMLGLAVSSLLSGWLVQRLGVIHLLGYANLLRGLGLLAFVFVPTWWLLVAACALAGLGAGSLASASNTYLARSHTPGRMSWMHASFGLGATFGPLLMSSLINYGYRWELGYLIVAGLAAPAGLLFAWQARYGSPKLDASPAVHSVERIGLLSTLRLPMVWAGIWIFFLYRGIEVTAGQWTYSLFTEARSASVVVAGVSVGLFWAGLTLGRILLGLFFGDRDPYPLLRVSIIGAVLGVALLVLNANQYTNFIGLGLTGFALAPIFPLLAADTPQRVGGRHTPNAVGFQIGGGSFGGGALPWLGGLMAARFGMESIGILLLITCGLLFLVFELAAYKAGRTGSTVSSANDKTLIS